MKAKQISIALAILLLVTISFVPTSVVSESPSEEPLPYPITWINENEAIVTTDNMTYHLKGAVELEKTKVTEINGVEQHTCYILHSRIYPGSNIYDWGYQNSFVITNTPYEVSSPHFGSPVYRVFIDEENARHCSTTIIMLEYLTGRLITELRSRGLRTREIEITSRALCWLRCYLQIRNNGGFNPDGSVWFTIPYDDFNVNSPFLYVATGIANDRWWA